MKHPLDALIAWSAHAPVLSAPRKLVVRAGEYVLRTQKATIIYYQEPERARVFDLISEIKKVDRMLFGITPNEAYQIYSAVRSTSKLRGDIAEVGVFRGGSARIICEARANKPVHLFDTFEGLPDSEPLDWNTRDRTHYERGQFAASLDSVRNYLKPYRDVHFYKGYFPDTAGPVRDRTFSFVHLDVDTLKSTRGCLEFFYERMETGGVIISHDYSTAAGVRKAFDEFFVDKPEPVIELAGSQCMAMKV